MENLLPHNGELFYCPDLFSKSESDAFFEDLKTNIKWEQQPITIFGKKILQPRLTAWYADKDVQYSYSGLTLEQKDWTPTLLDIKKVVEKISGKDFNSALLNYYRDGKDSMGWHRDNEKELGNHPTIASLSFGGIRKFQLREYQTKQNLMSLEPSHGSLILMSGQSQQFWEHAVPKTKKQVDPRINITFRLIL